MGNAGEKKNHSQPYMPGAFSIVATPAASYLKSMAAGCKTSITIASPFVNEGILKIAESSHGVKNKTLVTRICLMDFARKSSSLDALINLIDMEWTVFPLSALHAKIYVFDGSSFLITSANATVAGLTRNLECGIAIVDEFYAMQVLEILSLWLNEKGHKETTRKYLESLQKPVAAYREFLSTIPQPDFDQFDPVVAPTIAVNKERLVESFSGWRKLVIEGLFYIPSRQFDLQDVYDICIPIARKRYPSAKTPDATIRRVLQELRNLGLVEFLVKKGTYGKKFQV